MRMRRANKHKYFGTDGIRGPVGKFPITPDFVLKLGWAVGRVLSARGGDKVLIGKDTRLSGYMLESALEAGLSAAGMNIHLLGPMPTPAIAYLTRTLRAQVGIVISASHNPYQDNGIKFFSDEGFKLTEKIEKAIESQLDRPLISVEPAALGKAFRVKDAWGRYIEFCKSSVPHYASFKGLKIIMDCANGATYHVAPNVFRELQAEVIELDSRPNGMNINKNCGSTHPEFLQKSVIREKANLGIAFDGDGDRVIMVDHTGEIVDGDELMLIIARNRLQKGRIFGGIIGTYMSNMGLEIALKKMQIPFRRVKVGDQHVIEALKKEHWFLGGESSGHIVCRDITTTGDGIISALQVVQALCEQSKDLHELKKAMHKFPQKLINIEHQGNISFLFDPKLKQKIRKIEHKLQGHGRVLIRPSGTEPVIRIMVEGDDEQEITQLAEKLSEEFFKYLKHAA